MRIHIDLEESLVTRVDRIAGPRRRSRFIRDAVRAAVDREQRWSLIERSAGSVRDGGHEWDDDPAAWVRLQRFGDPERTG